MNAAHEALAEMDFGLPDFDVNAAVMGAMHDVVSNEELALDEKVRRMELIVSEGMSPVYQEFMNFRELAAFMHGACGAHGELGQAVRGSETLSGFMDNHSSSDGHDHNSAGLNKHEIGDTDQKSDDDDEYETDPKTGRRVKKRHRGWLSAVLIKRS